MFLKFGSPVAIALVVVALSISGCSDSDPDEQAGLDNLPATHTLYFQSLSQAKLTLQQNDTNISSVISSVFDEQRGSSFELFVDETIEDNETLKLLVSGGYIDDEVFDGRFSVSVSAKQLRQKHIVISSLSVLQDIYDAKHTDTLASSVLRSSVDDDGDIDRDDILYLSPKNLLPLVQPNLFKSLEENGFVDAIINDKNISSLLQEDSDNDGLNKFEEMVLGSLDSKIDSDGDGLNDFAEKELGTCLYMADSDGDGLDDKNETILDTSPTLADSDGDFIGDGVEIASSTNPMLADENGDGIKDGIDNDPLLFLQWHLKSEGSVVDNTNNVATIIGNDLGIFEVNALTSTQINKPKIQVIDTGVEAMHEDLDVDMTLSSNAINGTNDPTAVEIPSLFDKSDPLVVGHGTAVAGILGAKVQNGLGVRGVVSGAQIAGSNWLESGEIDKLETLWYASASARECAVSNNSWGAYYIADESFEQIMEQATSHLRETKGRIFVVPAGNEREEFGNSNLSYLANNPFVFTVAALNHENRYAFYSNPGANILVSAYGGERYFEAPTIASTLLMGKSYYESELSGQKGALTDDADLNRNYTVAMNGTSAATPMVSGVIVLVLDACPDLTWRDMKYLVATTSKRVDVDDSSWVKNSAGYWHSNNYGFGLINPKEMIERCRKGYFEALGELKVATSGTKLLNISIPDTNQSISTSINIDENLLIEWVGLVFKSDHPFSGDLIIDLISPSGTKSEIISSNDIRFDAYSDGFRFSSLAFLDEESKGVWRVVVRDAQDEDSGMLESLELIIRGR